MIYVENELMGKRLCSIRKALGMHYMDMAELLGISDGHYRKIERGIYGLDARKLLLLYYKLKVDPLYLLTGDPRRWETELSREQGHRNRDAMLCELLDYCKQQLTKEEE